MQNAIKVKYILFHMEQKSGMVLVRIKEIFTSPLFLLRICMGMHIDSLGNVRIDHQQTTKKKGQSCDYPFPT